MSHSKIIFAGPSLNGIDLTEWSELEFRPPCAQGDIYLASLENPKAIGIIDGYFEGVPSVWHKEILWGMHRGIHVFGASSMGALRAAELEEFGMQPIGKIAFDYCNLALEDDDEVALTHGPEELGHMPLTLPMVNLRASVAKALNHGVIEKPLADQLINTAKNMFYQTRDWASILEQCKLCKQEASKLDQLSEWLQDNAVDQKKEDAVLLCNTISKQSFDLPFEPAFEFEVTEFWHQNLQTWRQRDASETRPLNEKIDDEKGYRLFE